MESNAKNGTYSSRVQTDFCLARIKDSAGEGTRTFTRVYEAAACAAADQIDLMRESGLEAGLLAGMPVSIKDLFDVKGETTLAGSIALQDAPPARADAKIVELLRRAGAVIVGKTNMTEFAFSGLGINPHYGTPANPWRRDERCIPGGSSSGAGVSVADGMAVAAIGTDTGGSVRIPAAMCGLVGFKPTARTVPYAGTLPLSQSFDSIGPLARDVETCATVYSALAGTGLAQLQPRDPASLTFAVIRNYVLEQMDTVVARAYDGALQRLSAAGVRLKDVRLPVLDELPRLFVDGGIVAAEAFAWHRDLLESSADLYDPRVSVRILRGKGRTLADYLSLRTERDRLIRQWTIQISDVDAIIMPTVPVVPPTMDELVDNETYNHLNLLVLRNPTLVNALDGCAITLPCHEPGDAPVGFTLAGVAGQDHAILSAAKTLEPLLCYSESRAVLAS